MSARASATPPQGSTRGPDGSVPAAGGSAAAIPGAPPAPSTGARTAHARPGGPAAVDEPALLTAGLWVLAAYHIGLAVFMAAAPHTFYTSLGPFGPANDHYVRDTATFSAALGIGLTVAIRRPAWRVPVLAVVTAQFALHSINHLVDIGKAHPEWTGYFDFASLLASTLLLAWMLRSAAAAPPPTPSDRQGAPR